MEHVVVFIHVCLPIQSIQMVRVLKEEQGRGGAQLTQLHPAEAEGSPRARQGPAPNKGRVEIHPEQSVCQNNSLQQRNSKTVSICITSLPVLSPLRHWQ